MYCVVKSAVVAKHYTCKSTMHVYILIDKMRPIYSALRQPGKVATRVATAQTVDRHTKVLYTIALQCTLAYASAIFWPICLCEFLKFQSHTHTHTHTQPVALPTLHKQFTT